MSAPTGAHILVIPFPAQGHLIPLLDLANHLSIRGLTITLLVTPKNLPILHPLLSHNPSIQTLVLPFPKCPYLPPGVENVKDLPPGVPNPLIMRAFGALYDPLLDWFQTHPSPPVAIISDFFAGWTQRLASHLDIPRIAFYASSPFVISVFNWVFDNVRQVSPPESVMTMPEIPNSPSFLYRQLPSLFRWYIGDVSDMGFVKDGMMANNSSFGGVFNTFHALEEKYLDHVRKVTAHVHVWAVGPLLNDGIGGADRGGASSVPVQDVMSWLESCPAASVVYVCFGSQASLTRQQKEELAAGLEKSGARFVWCVKVENSEQAAASEYGVVPAGFEERTGGRGLVIKGWAPQVSILRHPSVGAFLTHCGWNSALEGLVAGVALLAWPMKADQYVNARLLVEEMGVAVKVCEGADTVPASGELARAIGESVSGKRQERIRALELSKAARDAVKDGGSSWRDMEGLVKELQMLGGFSPSDRREGSFFPNVLDTYSKILFM